MKCLADDIREEVEDHVAHLHEQVDSGQLDVDDLVERLQTDLQIKGERLLNFIRDCICSFIMNTCIIAVFSLAGGRISNLLACFHPLLRSNF